MSRGFSSPAVTDALTEQHVRLVTLVKLEFDTGTVYVHNGLGTYNWDGQNWLGLGNLASISSIEEGSDISPYGVTLSVSSIDASFAEQALEQNYYQRPVTIYLGVLNENDEFVQESVPANTKNPIQMWTGHIDQMSLTVGADGGDKISIQCESSLSLFARSRNLVFSNAWQQERYPDVDGQGTPDRFFNLLHLIEGVKIGWKQQASLPGTGAVDAPERKPPQRGR